MAIVIHHGPSGSYKSFSSVQRHAIPHLQKGGVLVTNIRGLNIEGVQRYSEPKQLPDSAQIIYINTDKKKGREHLARWWHWMPDGAILIMDEAQKIYPDRRGFNPKELSYEGGEDQADADNRPYTFEDAIDEHRHHNWDIYLCTTNIGKIHKEIRMTAEEGIRHVNVSNLLPWFKHTWYEHRHNPENNGLSKTHTGGRPTRYKADQRIFECEVYKSTKTGQHKQSEARQPIHKNKTVIFLLCVFIVSSSITIIGLYNKLKDDDSTEINNKKIDSLDKDIRPSNHASSRVVSNQHLADQPDDKASTVIKDITSPLDDYSIHIIGTFDDEYYFSINSDNSLHVPEDYLKSFGYTVTYISPCMAKLDHLTGSTRYTYCSLEENTFAALGEHAKRFTLSGAAQPSAAKGALEY